MKNLCSLFKQPLTKKYSIRYINIRLGYKNHCIFEDNIKNMLHFKQWTKETLPICIFRVKRIWPLIPMQFHPLYNSKFSLSLILHSFWIILPRRDLKSHEGFWVIPFWDITRLPYGLVIEPNIVVATTSTLDT